MCYYAGSYREGTWGEGEPAMAADSNSVRFEPDQPLMLRDGTITYADIFRPDRPGRLPALLQRTPYNKSTPHSRGYSLDAVRAAMAGYVVVIQDVRGRYTSDGEFYPFVDEMSDGYDSVEWVAGQPWCNGRVGMFGSSYVGATQWLAAKSKPPALQAIAPGVTASNYHDGWAWRGGAFELGFNLYWTMSSLVTENWRNLSTRLYLSPRQYEMLVEAKDNVMDSFLHLPLNDHPELRGDMAPYYFDWLDHPEYDEYWRGISIEEAHSEIDVPAFNYGGWYDIFLGGTIRNFTGMRERGGTEAARRGQRLVIGPWVHSAIGDNVAGERSFGSVASSAYGIDLQGQLLRYFDHWLRDEDNGVSEERPVTIFVMGENAWREEDEWPLSRAERVPFFMRSGGKANSLWGDGRLDRDSPSGGEPPDVYVYNPLDPVPTRGGPVICDAGFVPAGAYDQRLVESRHDVLVYTTQPLEEPLEVTGPVTATIYASSSAPDTDFTAKLIDVSPDGYARNVTEGIIRARSREAGLPSSAIAPGTVYKYDIDMWATSNVFVQGHRIRLEVSSSNFPKYDRNANTGEPLGSDLTVASALQTVHHSPEYPSHVTLPIVPRG